MITERITLPNGAIIEFFASGEHCPPCLLAQTPTPKSRRQAQRLKKSAHKRQRQARRRNRG